MKLIVGLGNPEKKYEKTRHNIGFRIIDKLTETDQYKNVVFKKSSKFSGQYYKKDELLLLKPLTYMNNSGQSVRALAQYFKINPDEMLVIHDDLDLSFGQIKFQKNKSSAGHNGVDSIIKSINSNTFWRLRIGINNGIKEKMPGDKFVTSNFTQKEEKEMDNITNRALELIFDFIGKKYDELTNKNIKIAV